MIADAINHVLFGWVALIPWWTWWALALAAVGAVYKFAGWPGIVALAGAVGYLLGRNGVSKLPDAVLPPAEPAKPAPPPKKRMKSLEDLIRGK